MDTVDKVFSVSHPLAVIVMTGVAGEGMWQQWRSTELPDPQKYLEIY